jgi:hypothetical protein
MIESLFTCDVCKFEQRANYSGMKQADVPPRWGYMRVEAGGSSASQAESMHVCPSCLNGLTAKKA